MKMTKGSLLDSWILYRCAEFLSGILPQRVFLFFVEGLVQGAFFAFFRKNRMILMRNFSLVFRHLTKSELKWLVLRNYRNFANFIYEFIRIPTMNLEMVRKNFVVEGLERVVEALRMGKGAILVTAHLGNWEMGGIATTLWGFPITVIAWPHRSKWVTDYFARRRASKGLKVVHVGNAIKEILRALQRNECVAILADRDFTRRGIFIPFFGKLVRFPVGAFQLSARTGAPVIPVFNIRRRDGKYSLIFESPILYQKEGKRVESRESLPPLQEILKECLRRWVSTLEKYVKKYPEQWYLFEPLFDPSLKL